MKATKGITIWERRAEFFVIGAVFVVLVIYLAGQFTSPNIKELGRGEKVGPGDWNGKLESTAGQISQAQSSDSVPDKVAEAIKEGEQSATVDLPKFQGKLTALVGPADAVSIPGYQVVPTVVGGTEAVAEGSLFVDPVLPPPTKPLVYQTFDLLSDGVVDQHEELKTVVSDPHPDITWLTIASEFNIAEALTRFRTGGSNGELPLRDRWHGNRVDLLDVRLEREELVDGAWTDAQLIAVLPGQVNFRDRLAKHEELDADDRDQILGAVVDPLQRSQIFQPDFLPTEQFRWRLPEEYQEEEAFETAMAEGSEDVGRRLKLKQLGKLNSKRANLLRALEEAQNSSGLAGSGDSGGGGGAGGNDGTRGGAGGGQSSGNSQEAQIQSRIDDLDRQIAKLREELGLTDDDQFGDDSSDSTDAASTAPGVRIVDESNEIWVWAYDVSIEPGKTYRYRLVLVVYNPLFARKLSLVEEQKHLSESLIKVVDASEWSDPIRAQPPLRVLASRAVPSGLGNNSGRLGYGEAVAEVWRFHRGQWYSRSFTVQPGDVIGRAGVPDGDSTSTVGPVDFSTGWYVVDIIPRSDATRSETRLGKGARVVLQNVADDRVITIDPVEDVSKLRPGEGAL
ncbi:MAG: hypothetical protein MK116_06875 [Phycisphaerales bacterium]|nr:hypothetical protein [Phycisphaerales bacterium]